MAKKLVKKPAAAKAVSKSTTSKPAAVKTAPSRAAKRPAVAAKPVAAKSTVVKSAKSAVVKIATKAIAGKTKTVAGKPAVAKPAVKTVDVKTLAPKSMKLAQPLTPGRPVVAAKAGVKNAASASAKLAIKPQNVAGLSTERATPLVKAANGHSKPAMRLVKAARPKPEPIPVRLPPAPVRSDSKMARNKAGITARELEHFRDLLFQKRRELTGDVSSMETAALRSGNGNLSTLPMHMADTGTDNYEQEFTLGLVEKDRKLLHEINIALAKIQDGSYGVCEGTGKPIAKPRLEAQPWAKYSIEHARALERPQFRRAF